MVAAVRVAHRREDPALWLRAARSCGRARDECPDRPADVLARHGGDEFALLLPGTDHAGADAVLARLCGSGDAVGWSVGVSEWWGGEDLDAALVRADKRLYETKHR